MGTMKIATWFNARKAAQVTAFFVVRDGGSAPVLKLIKLIYLSNRKHIEKFNFPIFYDCLVSMPHGPVNSMTLNFIDGAFKDAGWDQFIGGRQGYDVTVARTFDDDALDELSDAELESLNEVWSELGHMDRWVIRDYTHTHCPVWEDPNGSSTPIPYGRLLKHLRKQNVDDLDQCIREEREIDEVFASLRE